MKYLSELSPAECLLVLNGNDISLKELLKYTFLDLVLKKVLQVTEIKKAINPREGLRTYKYVKVGKNFNTYYPMAHERIFLSPFEADKKSEFLLRHFIKVGCSSIRNEIHYKNTLYNYPAIRKYFTRTFFQKLFGGSAGTSARLETASTIKAEIAELEKKLPDLLQNNRMQAALIMERIKGNVFLLKDTETSLHSQVERELAYELRNDKSQEYF